jgi:hypothetical protein
LQIAHVYELVQVLNFAESLVEVGITTDEIDRLTLVQQKLAGGGKSAEWDERSDGHWIQ